MHETAIAESLYKVILEESKKQGAKPVRATIICGSFNHLNKELVDFAFAAIAKGGICEGVALKIEKKPIRGQCKKCRVEFEFDISSPKCAACGSEDYELLPDEPLVLETIEFETEDL